MCAEYSTADILLRDTHPDFGIKLTVPFPYPYTDLQLQLQLLRDWLDRMETKVPKLVLRPKWTRETLDRRIVDYKVSLAAARWPLLFTCFDERQMASWVFAVPFFFKRKKNTKLVIQLRRAAFLPCRVIGGGWKMGCRVAGSLGFFDSSKNRMKLLMTRGKRKVVWSVTVRNRISFPIRLKADRRMNRGRIRGSNRMNIQPTQQKSIKYRSHYSRP